MRLLIHGCKLISLDETRAREIEFPDDHWPFIDLELSHDFDNDDESPTISINFLCGSSKDEPLLCIAVTGTEEIDALRRYFKMVLAHRPI